MRLPRLTLDVAPRPLQKEGLAGFCDQVARVVAGCAIHSQPHIDPRIQQLPHWSYACSSHTDASSPYAEGLWHDKTIPAPHSLPHPAAASPGLCLQQETDDLGPFTDKVSSCFNKAQPAAATGIGLPLCLGALASVEEHAPPDHIHPAASPKATPAAAAVMVYNLYRALHVSSLLSPASWAWQLLLHGILQPTLIAEVNARPAADPGNPNMVRRMLEHGSGNLALFLSKVQDLRACFRNCTRGQAHVGGGAVGDADAVGCKLGCFFFVQHAAVREPDVVLIPPHIPARSHTRSGTFSVRTAAMHACSYRGSGRADCASVHTACHRFQTMLLSESTDPYPVRLCRPFRQSLALDLQLCPHRVHIALKQTCWLQEGVSCASDTCCMQQCSVSDARCRGRSMQHGISTWRP